MVVSSKDTLIISIAPAYIIVQQILIGLGGFWNAVIFFRPQYLFHRGRKYTRMQAIKSVIFNKGPGSRSPPNGPSSSRGFILADDTPSSSPKKKTTNDIPKAKAESNAPETKEDVASLKDNDLSGIREEECAPADKAASS